MKTQQSIASLNAQLSTAVSILDCAAQELQSEWDNIPTLVAINVPMRDIMRDLRDAIAGGTMTEYMANAAQWPRLG